jgi:hypothetical protein
LQGLFLLISTECVDNRPGATTRGYHLESFSGGVASF